MLEISIGKDNSKDKNKNKTNKKKKGFGKQLLIADYVIAAALIIVFFICICVNGIYTMKTLNDLIELGVDISAAIISPPFNLDTYGVVLSAWIIQLGVSSGAYYVLTKSEHKMQLPMQLINDLPKDIKDQVDLTQIITSVLSNTGN